MNSQFNHQLINNSKEINKQMEINEENIKE